MKEITQINWVKMIRTMKVEKDMTVFLKVDDRQKLMIKGTIICKDSMTNKGQLFHLQRTTDSIEMKKLSKMGQKIQIGPLGRIQTIRFFLRRDL